MNGAEAFVEPGKKFGRSPDGFSQIGVSSLSRRGGMGSTSYFFLAAAFLAAGFLATVFLATGFFTAAFLAGAFFAGAFLAGAFFAAAFLAGAFLTGISIPPFPSATAGKCENHVNNSRWDVNSSLMNFRQRNFWQFRLIFFAKYFRRVRSFAREARVHQPSRRSHPHSRGVQFPRIRRRAFLPPDR